VLANVKTVFEIRMRLAEMLDKFGPHIVLMTEAGVKIPRSADGDEILNPKEEADDLVLTYVTKMDQPNDSPDTTPADGSNAKASLTRRGSSFYFTQRSQRSFLLPFIYAVATEPTAGSSPEAKEDWKSVLRFHAQVGDKNKIRKALAMMPNDITLAIEEVMLEELGNMRQETDEDLVRCLADAEFTPNMNLDGADGWTMLTRMAESGSLDSVRLFLDLGAEPNKYNAFRKTALMIASMVGRSDVVHLLLAHNADGNLANRFGETALISAAERGQFDICKALLESGAKPSILNRFREDACTVARDNGYKHIVVLLKEWEMKEIEERDAEEKRRQEDGKNDELTSTEGEGEDIEEGNEEENPKDDDEEEDEENDNNIITREDNSKHNHNMEK